MITRRRIISYPRNYHFFPRSDLTAAYEKYEDADSSDFNKTDTLDYYPFLKTCDVIGTAYQQESYDFIFGFSEDPLFLPRIFNKTWDVLFDSGKIILHSESQRNFHTLFFDTCALKYKDADIFNTQLTIQNNSRSEDLVLGYVRTVYLSPSGKLKSTCVPLDHTSVTVDTKDGNYFLKELCIFSAYEKKLL